MFIDTNDNGLLSLQVLSDLRGYVFIRLWAPAENNKILTLLKNYTSISFQPSHNPIGLYGLYVQQSSRDQLHSDKTSATLHSSHTRILPCLTPLYTPRDRTSC